MAFVHNVDLRKLHGNPRLDQALAGLPGRKVIFTNASVAHAERITEHLGIRRHFCKVFDIRHSGFVPKPQVQGYERVLATLGEDPAQMVMVEDIARNLYPAAALGMTTVWLRGDSEWADAELEPQRDQAIHHITEDLPGWLLALPGSGPLAS